VSEQERVHPAAAVGFDKNASEYERARPEYPPETLDVLRRDLGVAAGSKVLDLAAGTGKFTRLAASAGLDVVAVEPVAGMRAQLQQVLPDVDVLDGTAEAIPFPDGTFDAVVVAQAFHWFRFDEALHEIRRVLRPGGGLAIVFNRRDDGEPWVAEWSTIIDWHQRTVSSYQRTDWSAVLGDAGFADVTHSTIHWVQSIDRGMLADRVRSISYVAVMEPDEQQAKVDAVLALTDGFDEPFDLPYDTLVWTARRN
jgi:ubiquinone/menaquinone biosynthesis C-methylase UbiE